VSSYSLVFFFSLLFFAALRVFGPGVPAVSIALVVAGCGRVFDIWLQKAATMAVRLSMSASAGKEPAVSARIELSSIVAVVAIDVFPLKECKQLN
jgi:hypothetical protein